MGGPGIRVCSGRFKVTSFVNCSVYISDKYLHCEQLQSFITAERGMCGSR